MQVKGYNKGTKQFRFGGNKSFTQHFKMFFEEDSLLALWLPGRKYNVSLLSPGKGLDPWVHLF